MSWQLKRNQQGRPYLEVSYNSSAHDWDAKITAALAGAGVRRGQLACIIATPATSARAGSREGSECR
jgi:hypothetical protein